MEEENTFKEKLLNDRFQYLVMSGVDLFPVSEEEAIILKKKHCVYYPKVRAWYTWVPRDQWPPEIMEQRRKRIEEFIAFFQKK